MVALITPEVYTSMGLNDGEYALILELLGREPTYTELGMFAVMWSEHCGYKYSRPVLAYFSEYKKAMEGEGLENAGVVDIGDGLGITMKVESHNHPSAVEPYQGAATGVGGIIRDILTMGARPIAGLNSLRFGPIQGEGAVESRNRYLFEHVVAGIAGYGNCVGVPTVGGEVAFHARYSGNPLVNAMCVGLLKLDEVTTAAASGIGNPVIYLGSATGKDGIHGATFASDALGEDSEAKRPNVQIGDPFAEKLVIEATLEALATGAVVAIQDMGAAGLTCSTVEMASKGRVGMEIDLDKVPMRESDMTAYELMLSESQERMMAVAQKGREDEVISIFRKWGTKAEVVGRVTDDGVLTVRRNGVVEASLDPTLLTDHCPTYTTPPEEPSAFRKSASFDPSGLAMNLHDDLLKVLAYPDVASKRWVYQQYDQQVQTQTAVLPGAGDAAVLALRETKKGISLSLDGNARWTLAHPYRGGLLAVCEAARNVACTGATPMALTDGLNFGNPQQGRVYWQFDRAVKGIADAAEGLGTPVISGNVSFYNESDLGEVPPTPLIGAVGLLDDASRRLEIAPQAASTLLRISIPEVMEEQQGLGASAWLVAVHGQEEGYPVTPYLAGERRLHRLLSEGAKSAVLSSAHDVSEGGGIVALAEIALKARMRVEAEIDSPFAEIPGQVFVASQDPEAVQALAQKHGLIAAIVGRTVAGSGLSVNGTLWSYETLVEAYEDTLPKIMEC